VKTAFGIFCNITLLAGAPIPPSDATEPLTHERREFRKIEMRAEYSLYPSGLLCYRTNDDRRGFCRRLEETGGFLPDHGSDSLVVSKNRPRAGDKFWGFRVYDREKRNYFEGCVEHVNEKGLGGYWCKYYSTDELVTRRGQETQAVMDRYGRWAKDFYTVVSCLKAVWEQSAENIVDDCT